MDDYLGRLNGLVVSLGGFVSSAGLSRVQHLIDHDEGPEGMLALAWIIVEEKRKVPRWVIEATLELGGNLIREEDWPTDLWSQAEEN